MVELPGHAAIDLTPDVIAALAEATSRSELLEEGRNLLTTNDLRRDGPTRVHFP